MINFSSVGFETFIGTVIGKPATVCLPPPGGEAPKSVQVAIDWLLYNVGDAKPDYGVGVNLQGIQPANAISVIKSVYIDNLESAVPIYVYFPDTGFTAPMAPYSSGWIPVITNNLKAIIYGIGFSDNNVPLTNVFFNNFSMPMAFQTIPQSSVIAPVLINAVGGVSLASAGTTQTFTATPIGDAGTGRRIVVAVVYGSNNGAVTNTVLTSMTLGGNAMTLISNTASGGPTNCSMGIINLDAGTTATIICNFNNSVGRCRIYVWTMFNNISNTPTQTDVRTAAFAASCTLNGSILLPQRGGLISVGCAEQQLEAPVNVQFSSSSGIVLDNSGQQYPTGTRSSAFAFGHITSPSLQDPYAYSNVFTGNALGTGLGKMIGASFSPG